MHPFGCFEHRHRRPTLRNCLADVACWSQHIRPLLRSKNGRVIGALPRQPRDLPGFLLCQQPGNLVPVRAGHTGEHRCRPVSLSAAFSLPSHCRSSRIHGLRQNAGPYFVCAVCCCAVCAVLVCAVCLYVVCGVVCVCVCVLVCLCVVPQNLAYPDPTDWTGRSFRSFNGLPDYILVGGFDPSEAGGSTATITSKQFEGEPAHTHTHTHTGRCDSKWAVRLCPQWTKTDRQRDPHEESTNSRKERGWTRGGRGCCRDSHVGSVLCRRHGRAAQGLRPAARAGRPVRLATATSNQQPATSNLCNSNQQQQPAHQSLPTGPCPLQSYSNRSVLTPRSGGRLGAACTRMIWA